MGRAASQGYVRHTVANEVTGSRVLVVDLSHNDSPRPPGWIVEQRDLDGRPVRSRMQRWGVECVEHATVVPHEVLSDARADADDPRGWCARCADALASSAPTG